MLPAMKAHGVPWLRRHLAGEIGLEAAAEGAERDALFTRALAELSETDRQAVVARLRLGYSYDQIALVLGKRSADSARMTVTRAIERLARRLDELASGQ